MILLWALLAAAQAQDRQPIVVDAYNGKVVGSARTVGLGGAYTGIAEGAAAHFTNPAAVARRAPTWPELAWHADGALQASGIKLNDPTSIAPDGLGSRSQVQVGGNIKKGRLGGGVHLQRFGTEFRTDPNDEDAVAGYQYGILAMAAGGTFFDGQLTVGTLAELVYGQVVEDKQVVSGHPAHMGAGAAFGGLVVPDDLNISAGMMLQPPLRTQGAPQAGVGGVRVPGQVGMGMASWRGDRAARYTLIAFDAVVTGNSFDAQSFTEIPRYGRTVLSIRGGLESTVIEDYLTLRGGLYNAPQRYLGHDVGPVMHAGFGADFGLFNLPETFRWKVGLGFDYSADGLSTAVAIGRW